MSIQPTKYATLELVMPDPQGQSEILNINADTSKVQEIAAKYLQETSVEKLQPAYNVNHIIDLSKIIDEQKKEFEKLKQKIVERNFEDMCVDNSIANLNTLINEQKEEIKKLKQDIQSIASTTMTNSESIKLLLKPIQLRQMAGVATAIYYLAITVALGISLGIFIFHKPYSPYDSQ